MIRLKWEDNGKAMYHITSAAAFDEERAKHQIPHLIHAYLDGYIYDTYQQYTTTDRHGRNLTNELRQHRNTKWWDHVKTMPCDVRKRQIDMPVHQTAGTIPEHEDFRNEVYGSTDWQDTITQLTKKQWWNQCRKVIANHSEANRLPPDPRPTTTTTTTNTKKHNRLRNR